MCSVGSYRPSPLVDKPNTRSAADAVLRADGPERVDAIRSADDAASLLNGNPDSFPEEFYNLTSPVFAWLGGVLLYDVLLIGFGGAKDHICSMQSAAMSWPCPCSSPALTQQGR